MSTLEGISLKMLHEGMRGLGGGGGGSIGHLTFIIDTIHPIDYIFGTYNELSLYFQLIETTWGLIGFHGNHNHIGRHLRFSNFQIFFIFDVNTEKGEKTTFTDWNLQNCKISVFRQNIALS